MEYICWHYSGCNHLIHSSHSSEVNVPNELGADAGYLHDCLVSSARPLVHLMGGTVQVWDSCLHPKPQDPDHCGKTQGPDNSRTSSLAQL
jgi:hypothetical protein